MIKVVIQENIKYLKILQDGSNEYKSTVIQQKTLYVTTFNRALFHATGLDMINSFLKSGTCGDFLIAYEDDIQDEIPSNDRIILFSLDKDDFLINWLDDNKDVIPAKFGGEFEGWCDCKKMMTKAIKETRNKDKKFNQKEWPYEHTKGCPNN